MKSEIQPHAKRCGAKTRSGVPCNNSGMRNGRCRMHGGKSPGPPKGNKNAFKHGMYTKESIAERKIISKLLRNSRGVLKEIV